MDPLIYQRIDNELYQDESDPWWSPDSVLSLMSSSLNPARVGYLKRVIFDELGLDPRGLCALEVGCGGGVLTEEIARMGFGLVVGVDPACRSLQSAMRHAPGGAVETCYLQGVGEALPFADRSFAVVFCCDVLEHVRELPAVLSEIARVLKPGGVFCYDTINRTLASWLIAIKISQQWKPFAFAPPRLHVWEMFIRPREMQELLETCGLKWRGHRGMKPNRSLPGVLWALRQRARGKMSLSELGRELFMVECRGLSLMYLGYAVKPPLS